MRSEKGQAIVFLALGFVAFLGFVALAIDGGMVYADRRHAQNGSDASALAGAGTAALSLANDSYAYDEVTYPDWNCNSVLVQKAEWLAQNAAIARGGSNGFSIDQEVTDTDYITDWNNTFVSTHCENADIGAIKDAWLDVTVNISDTTETSFAQLLFPQPLHNVVSATARVFPKAPFGFGQSIVALRERCEHNPNEGGAHFNGSNNVYISGGGIWSNACVQTSGGNNNVVEVDPGDNVCFAYQEPDGTWTECYENNGDPDFSPIPDPGIDGEQISLEINPPACPGGLNPAVKLNGNDSAVIYPGNYPEITVNGGTLTLMPGLYCILKPSSPNIGNGDVYFNGGIIEGPDGYDETATDPYETGVSFYLDRGSFATSGNATVRLTAAMQGSCTKENESDPDPCPGISLPYMTAILVHLDASNTSDVTLVGTGDDRFTGLIFAPNGTANLVGNGDTVSFDLQVIADTISVGGNAVLNINYDKDLQRWTSAMIELAK